ncbi:pyrophosphatase/phosphodiesterase [Tolypocladium capitatum]|uniref:Pyrophosphatase/phosphodiesterase n=1 Tax=Tolypocladium capitatum TaxID=45235 RepID=A0A2K3QI04_9HYPO|nr:pyrophosphatase/phosphodiesterase [Tolypocladium capitatum]
MPPSRLDTNPPDRDNGSLLSPIAYDDDASSIHSRSDQDTDSDDDQLLQRARNSRELRAHDRILLVEEEDVDRLVTSSRRQQERQRRGSGLAVPNPLKIFGRKPSLSNLSAASRSTESLVSEKRTARRQRRRQKREKLMEDAHHGEDGGLMYEMEEGGMREGSSTGDSSDREDSDEVDRRRLNMMASAKAERGRSWRRWIFIHSLIAIGFAILVLVAWKLSKKHRGTRAKSHLVSNGTALFAPTTIIISLDGFRADFLQRGITPRLNALIEEGASPKYMLPSFPSVTFPNHYTLATGLYPESHGLVGNTFWDPELEAEFYYTDPERSLDPKWWKGEPFWVTAELQGIRTAIHMWPGSEAHILHVEPSFLDKYNGEEKLSNKVSRILEFLDKPGKEDESVNVEQMRPQLIAAYVPDVDADGHRYGPNSTEIRSTIEGVDTMLDQLSQGLEHRNLTNIVNVIVVSDHGMATTDVSRLMQLEDLVDTSKIAHTDGWPLYGLRPKDDKDLQDLYDGLKEKAKSNPNFDVFLRHVDMPERYHFSNNDRIAPLWIVPKTGWAIVTKAEFDVKQGKEKGLVYHPRGLHGYDHEHPLMRAIFIARGPAFPHPANSQLEPFQNTEVYNILADSIGMVPKPNNGTLRLPLKPIGTHKPDDRPEQPADPPHPSTAEPPTAGPSKHPERPTRPATPTQHERPTPSPTPPQTQEPAPPSDGNDKNQGDDDGKDSGSIKDKVKGLWDWLTDKVGHLWDKITGTDSDSDSDSDSD